MEETEVAAEAMMVHEYRSKMVVSSGGGGGSGRHNGFGAVMVSRSEIVN